MRPLAFLALAACGGAAQDAGPAEARRAVPLIEPFDLAMGATAEVGPEALTIELRDLAEESRCPPGAQCPTAGNAAVGLGVEASDGGTATITLNTGREPREVGTFGHLVRLEGLEPGPPPAGQAPDTAAYVATLVVTREGI